MSEGQAPVGASFPREIFNEIIWHFVESSDTKDALALRQVCYAFKNETTKLICSRLVNEPDFYKTVWRHFSVEMKTRVLDELRTGLAYPATIYRGTMQEMLKLVQPDDREATALKLVEAIAHSDWRREGINALLVSRALVDTETNLAPRTRAHMHPWLKISQDEPADVTLRTLLAFHALRRQNVTEFAGVLANCTKRDVFRTDLFGIDLFNTALTTGSIEIANELLRFMTPGRLRDLDPDYSGWNHEAIIRKGNTSILGVFLMFAEAASEECGKSALYTAFKDAAALSKPDMAQWILDHCNVDKYDRKALLTEGFNAAIMAKSVIFAKFIITCDGFDVNQVGDGLYDSPLGKVLRLTSRRWQPGQCIQLVKLLLDRGANPNVTKQKETPLSLAISANDLDAISLLLDHGAGIVPNAPPKPPKDNLEFYLVLYTAVLFGNSGVVKLLLEKGVSPVVQTSSTGKGFRVELLPSETTVSFLEVWTIGDFLERKEISIRNMPWNCEDEQRLTTLRLMTGVRDKYGLRKAFNTERIRDARVRYTVKRL
ncbi:ankyrin repeat domain-containing protein [Aspergillus mulundensis]|uniref:Uncharacterized protein n=1 Tax=Aspergillus mulundensis TaxID=1810919 RepID=A0A3D8R412_9EURO|nr:hypothetical protein DSM5745_08487 [Aspergillus mulundensis]RDW68727.1 hypothetical protein DSM5745_08487 [Aspergillus mulundensis]